MSSVRKDIFTGYMVLISEARGKRPLTLFSSGSAETCRENCPFCPGNEHITPAKLHEGEKNWSTRFFANKYPALDSAAPDPDEPFYGSFDGAGIHEIFVDTRSHDLSLKDFPLPHIEEVIKGLIGRYCHCTEKGVGYIQIFKNSGIKAGASQSHSHWQILAGSFVPQMQQTLAKRLSEYRIKTGKCLYCAVLENELKHSERIVADNNLFSVIAPYASRFSYETWIVPKRHISVVSELTGSEIKELSKAIKHITVKLEQVKPNTDYNILFMDSPATDERELFHWHIQILPKMGNLAGYEFATGSYINHITPEEAAKRLR